MSRQNVVVGIDVGTSSVKVVATDLDGRLVAEASTRYPTMTDLAGGAEQDAEAWWAAVSAITPTVVRDAKVAAVAVTSQAPTLVPVDAAGSTTGPALTWLDRRAIAEARRIGEIVPESRNGADPFFGTAKLPWLLAERPSIAARTAHVLSANGFIVQRLTGVATLDDTSASLMQGFDETSDAFDEQLMSADLGLHLLPPIVRAAAIVGTVTVDAAQATGLPAGTPVVAGGIDSVGSALEAGTLAVGDPLVEMTGFSSVTILAAPAGVSVPGFIHARHAVEGVDLLITAQVTAGATVDWMNGLDSTADLRDSDAILARSRPSRLTMVPSLAGERTPSWNMNARGIIDGIDLATDGTELMLAVMEGNALALATDVQSLRAHGYTIDRMLGTGGGSTSPAWLQIKSDALGIPVQRPASGHGAAQGASYLAGLAVGVHASVESLRALSAGIEAEYAPDADRHAAYVAKLERYRELTALNTSR
ncbi:FGGY-family carbohydrate kinase [Microbacterium sp. NPDC056234]|uniref:xylulokinase n=1 Tax=Microbacterium sp. NPDC056234 TaxID=3345757 RepID=UPI0035DDC7C9